MDSLLFVTPSEEWEAAAADYLQEHLAHGETALHGSALLDQMPFTDWLRRVRANASPGTAMPGCVPASTYFVARESDGRLVGMADLRHALNDFLRAYGGHIGYGVRPSERRKGYAAQILRTTLDLARHQGIPRVMISCNRDNEGSRRTILRCGGVLEREFLHTDGHWIQIYWIDLA